MLCAVCCVLCAVAHNCNPITGEVEARDQEDFKASFTLAHKRPCFVLFCFVLKYQRKEKEVTIWNRK